MTIFYLARIYRPTQIKRLHGGDQATNYSGSQSHTTRRGRASCSEIGRARQASH